LRPRPASGSIGWLGVLWAQLGVAQQDAPLPPRLDDAEPGTAVLARLPEDRREELEEIVVIAEERWRLPDLGSSWRDKAEERDGSRVTVDFVPLYDPEMADRLPDLFQLNKQEERIGYLELFRIEFGARPE
jgi:hypothetical protein